MAAVRTGLVTSDGIRLSVLEAGEGPVRLAFVPGWCMPASIWNGQFELLSPHFRVTALDPRGQGDSEIAANGYGIERRADDIADFLAARRPSVLVAWSLAALEVLECLARHGEDLLQGLVIVDSSVGVGPVPPRTDDFLEVLRSDRAAAMEGFVRALFRSARPEAEIQALLAQSLRMPLEASLSLFPRHLPREHWRDRVTKFGKPLLYCVTAQFEQQAEDLHRLRPQTRIEIFRDAGHALFVDQPERFAAMLREFALGLTAN